MPAIPEFLLRKLFVPGSLHASESGFVFELNNAFAPVTLVGLEIHPDGVPVPLETILVSLPDQGVRPAVGISLQSPFSLPVNVPVHIQVAAQLPRKKLIIRAQTREAGLLHFGIPLGRAGRGGRLHVSLPDAFLHPFQNVIRLLRARRDPAHPNIHFTPPSNWMNDPNGLIHWQGNHHLFYQYNPSGVSWGNIHWGHAISKDMLHWKHLPLALAPDPGGPDAGGCFSGCAVDYEGEPTLLYTGVFPEVQCLAVGHPPGLLKWSKDPRPVLSAPPAGLQLDGFRDPFVWKQGQEWRMVLGSGIHDLGGAILLYRSTDLRHWEYMGILFQGLTREREPLWTGSMWECPSFFPLDGKWVLIFSVFAPAGALYTIYYIGEYSEERFIPDGPATLLDFGAGGSFYAPHTFLDAHARRVMFGWLRESQDASAQQRAGWSGALSFPRLLSLGMDGRLSCRPLNEISSLRGEHVHINKPGPACMLFKGGCLELRVNVPPGSGVWNGVSLESVQAPGERVKISYDYHRNMLVVDCSQAGALVSQVPLPFDPSRGFALHAFVDASILEVFIDDRQPVSARFYVSGRDFRLRCAGPVDLELWKLNI